MIKFYLRDVFLISFSHKKSNTGTTKMTNLLKCQALLKSKCMACCIARVIPHPKHSRSSNILDMQRDSPVSK